MNGIAEQGRRDYAELVDDPASAEDQGASLVALLADVAAEVVLAWDDGPSVVLAHVVGFELGLQVIRIAEVGGIVEFASDPPEPSRVLLLCPQFREEKDLLAMRALVRRQGGTVAAVAALDDSEVTASARNEGLRVVALRRPH